MCGRVVTKVTPNELKDIFGVLRGLESIDFTPRFNVGPTRPLICVRETDEGREAFTAEWGLQPPWSDGKMPGTFNAKSETVDVKPTFRAAFQKRRCLVVVTGFIEWTEPRKKFKVPHFITLRSGEPMAMAGLWETRGPTASCTICTTDANPFMVPLHDRMPVVLPDAMIAPWLDRRKTTAKDLKPLLAQLPSDLLQEQVVNRDINTVKNQGEYLIEPASELPLG